MQKIVNKGVEMVWVFDHAENIITEMQGSNTKTVPVVGEVPVRDNIRTTVTDEHLIGVVTASDLAELVDDALSDDYAKLGGLSEEEDLAEPVWQSIRKRMPWLVILLVLGLGVSAVVGKFTTIAASLPVLLCFQSLILDMAGNVGTQSLAVVTYYGLAGMLLVK